MLVLKLFFLLFHRTSSAPKPSGSIECDNSFECGNFIFAPKEYVGRDGKLLLPSRLFLIGLAERYYFHHDCSSSWENMAGQTSIVSIYMTLLALQVSPRRIPIFASLQSYRRHFWNPLNPLHWVILFRNDILRTVPSDPIIAIGYCCFARHSLFVPISPIHHHREHSDDYNSNWKIK